MKIKILNWEKGYNMTSLSMFLAPQRKQKEITTTLQRDTAGWIHFMHVSKKWGPEKRWGIRGGVPVTELEAGRACRAMSGWDGLWLWRTCIWWALDITCCPPSAWLWGASKGCWEGTVVGGRWGVLIFSAISCSLILLIKTRLSSWQPGNNICDKRTVISSVTVSLWHDGSL